jgi:hypothetical protein
MHMSIVLKAVPCLWFQAREKGSTLLVLLHKANHEEQFLFYKCVAVKEPLQKEVAESKVTHSDAENFILALMYTQHR